MNVKSYSTQIPLPRWDNPRCYNTRDMAEQLQPFSKQQTITNYDKAVLEKIQQEFDAVFHPRKKALKAIEEIRISEETRQQSLSLKPSFPKEQK